MKPIRTARHFEILCLGAILWFLPASPSFAQGDLAQFLKRNPSTPATVSKNQLLAPAKAMRALERARKEIHDGHLESAQKEITCALNIAPHLAIAKALQGAIDLETQNFEEATTFFQQALQDDPALGAAYLGMATILIHQGRSQAALPLLDRADGLLPGAWLVHFVKAWAQLETGNVEAALKQADYAERAAGADSEQRSGVLYLRAMVSVHSNDLAAARARLGAAIALDPRGEYAAPAREELQRLQLLLASTR